MENHSRASDRLAFPGRKNVWIPQGQNCVARRGKNCQPPPTHYPQPDRRPIHRAFTATPEAMGGARGRALEPAGHGRRPAAKAALHAVLRGKLRGEGEEGGTDGGVALLECADALHGRDDGGVVLLVELLGDGLELLLGQLAAEVHRDLPW